MACQTAAHVCITVLLMAYLCMGSCGRIDTHHHILPPDYLGYCQEEGENSSACLGKPMAFTSGPCFHTDVQRHERLMSGTCLVS